MSSHRKTLFVLSVACLSLVGWVASAHAFGGFIENRGQLDQPVKYYGPGSRVSVYFTDNAVVLDLKEEIPGSLRRSIADPQAISRLMDEDEPSSQSRRGCAIYIRFDGANPSPVVEARGELETEYNYFLGNDPSRWESEVPAYAEILYRGVWPGVDLVFREDGGNLTYETVLSPGADAQTVQFRYEGADRVTKEPDGSFLVETSVGSLREVGGPVGGSVGVFVLARGDLGNGGSPALEDNPSSLLWGTFLGGGAYEQGYCPLVLDSSGNPVVAGWTRSPDFPTTPGAYSTSYNGGSDDAFIAKLSASGSVLLWSTFLGGTSMDEVTGLTLDAADNPVVTGGTYSADFPTTPGAYNRSLTSLMVFVTKVSASGSVLVWSTFLGPGRCPYIAMDSLDNPVATGYTQNEAFPRTSGAYDTSFNGRNDVFVSKLSAAGSALIWSTLVGGISDDGPAAIVLDSSDNSVLVGYTNSSDFPATSEEYDTSYNGAQDVFVAKVSASGSELVWSTFLGGTSDDVGFDIAMDSGGSPVVTGWTRSFNFPTTSGVYDTSLNSNGYPDVFVSNLSASGSELVWSTFLGGMSNDYGHALALDAADNVIVAGVTGSPDFPTTTAGFDTSLNANGDAFVTELSATGSAVVWSSFLGGCLPDEGDEIALDSSGNPVVAGATSSTDFPTTMGGYDTSGNGAQDLFVAKLDLAGVASVRSGGTDLGSARLYPSLPDPFRASTAVQFYLPEPQRVSIEVYDVQGRVVQTLMDAVTESGTHQMQWDGRSENDTEVAPGIYFLRMEAGSYRATKKVVLVR